MRSQFLRAHAYSVRKIQGVLDEADRNVEATGHIKNPKTAIWILGTRAEVDLAVNEYMRKLSSIDTGKIKYKRKKRKDHRCLTAGVVSWPISIQQFIDDIEKQEENKKEILAWRDKTMDWLKNQYNESLKGVCMHIDESHFHIHFFVVGDAQRIHPGLRAELVDNIRIADPKRRFVAHKKGLTLWLDDYHAAVGKLFSLSRKENSKPSWRILDRRIRETLIKLDEVIAKKHDLEIKEQRDLLWDMSQKEMRGEMNF